MNVTPQHREEAKRLLSLDDKGLEIEAVAQILAAAEVSEASAKALRQLDLDCLRLLGGQTFERFSPESVPEDMGNT